MEDRQLGYFVEPWRKKAGGFSRAFVYTLIATGKLETAKIGGRRVILTPPRDFLHQYIEKREQ